MFERRYGITSNDQSMIADNEGFILMPNPEPQPESPTPPAGPNLVAWYKADAQSFSDGDLVTSIVDSSGNGNDLDTHGNPSPSAQEPHFYANVLNALPVFRFNDIDAIFRHPVSVADTGYTLAIVVKSTATLPYSLLAISSARFEDGNLSLEMTPSGSNVVFRGYGYGSAASITVALGTWQIVTLAFDATEGIPRLRTNDDFAQGSASPGGVVLSALQLQGNNGLEIAEVFHYSEKLSDADLSTLRLYLSQKYEIPISV
jgi:hypothetical protein